MAVSCLYVTEEPGAGFTEVDLCTLQINLQHEAIPSIVCSVCLSFGLIYCFFGVCWLQGFSEDKPKAGGGRWGVLSHFNGGYRCFKMIMFFSGFMFGSGVVLLFYHKEPALDSQLGVETKAGISLGVGVLCGLMTMLVSMLGLVLSGLQLGSLVSLSLLVVISQFYSLAPAWALLSAVLAASISSAMFTLQWQKLFSIIYTSVLGATIVMLCVDFLLGAFMLPDQLYDLFGQVAPRPLCWFNWAITGICPFLSVLGVLVQWWFTARGFSHSDAAHKKQKKQSMKYKCRESRRRPQPYRQRRPPPLKRYAGDVLAPSYLRRLQEHQLGTGSSTSSISTVTHTLIDFNFETGSMVPLTAASPIFTV